LLPRSSENEVDLMDITQIGETKFPSMHHNNDTIRTLNAKMPEFKKRDRDFTEEFFKSLKVEFYPNQIQLFNIHIYGGPGTGKSTLARTIGYNIKEHFGDDCQCLECQYLPDAMHHIDPEKEVFVISVDDPMGAAAEGGTQDARKGMSDDVDVARALFNGIRHRFAKIILLDRAEQLYEGAVPDEVVEAIDKHHDHRDKLKDVLPDGLWMIDAVIFTIWGPQLPTIDSTFHQNKMWNIYKGLSSMDDKRKAEMRKVLGSYWMSKLGEKERDWRRKRKEEARSWSVIEDGYTNEKGWLYVEKNNKNVFEPVDRGGKGFQKKIKATTEQIDEWAQYIYENRNSLTPPYDPYGKQEDRRRSLNNFITDVLSRDVDPRTFKPLAPHIQIFLKKVRKGKIQEVDNRIIKYHYNTLNKDEKISSTALQLKLILEEEGMSPNMKAGRQIAYDLARRKIKTDEQFIEKGGNFTKIFNHLLYLWHSDHPEQFSRKQNVMAVKTPPINREAERELLDHATTESDDRTIEFTISEEDIADIIIENHPEWRDRALIYLHTEGIGEYEPMTNSQVYRFSHMEQMRERYGFREPFTSEEAVKYRKREFRGIMSNYLGKLFEKWMDDILMEGCYIPGVLESISDVQHGGGIGQPDFTLIHDDGSYTVLSVKCYNSSRSETLKRGELSPEIQRHNNLLEKGHRSRIMVIYRNIRISGMLAVFTYNSAADIPERLTFSPAMAGQYAFVSPD